MGDGGIKIKAMKSILAEPTQSELTVREINILKSPKKGGSSYMDAAPYIEELGITIPGNIQPIQFVANTKLNCWDISPNYLLKIYNDLPRNACSSAPSFLKSSSHFNKGVLRNLETIKSGIESIEAKSEKQRKVKDLIKLAFSSILIDCSNMKRTPCLGYYKNKEVYDTAPFVLLDKKIRDIADDLRLIQSQQNDFINTESKVIIANAMDFKHTNEFDLIITSPPYMNGLDYVMNYKIEKARERRSGQIRIYKLRESNIILLKR